MYEDDYQDVLESDSGESWDSWESYALEQGLSSETASASVVRVGSWVNPFTQLPYSALWRVCDCGAVWRLPNVFSPDYVCSCGSSLVVVPCGWFRDGHVVPLVPVELMFVTYPALPGTSRTWPVFQPFAPRFGSEFPSVPRRYLSAASKAASVAAKLRPVRPCGITGGPLGGFCASCTLPSRCTDVSCGPISILRS